MRLTLALLALPAALTLAACGSSTTTTRTVAQSAGATTTSPAATTTTGAGTTTNAPATQPTAGTPACVASMLSLREIGSQGATGHIEVGLAFRNTSSSSCHTYGYPGVLFLGKAGQSLPTKSMRTTTDFAGHVPKRVLIVAPGRAVSFRLLFEDFGPNGSSAGCHTADGLQAIAPDDTTTLRTKITRGVTECGTTTVSPLAPGNSAYR
jgi:hypothetical protein